MTDVPRSVVITGASRGLGRSLALSLQAYGFRVFAGVRTEADAAVLSREGLVPVQLDVRDPGSVATAVTTVTRATGDQGLAGLVNNAGVLLMGPVEQTPLDAIEDLFQVNFLGPVSMIQQFLPLLRKARGRIVNISSVNGRLAFPLGGVYSASKFALEALTDALRVELRPWGIAVSLVEPGVTTSEIRVRALEHWVRRHAALPPAERALYEVLFQRFQVMLGQLESTAAGPEDFSQAVVHALTAELPDTRYLAGPDTVQWMELAARSDSQRDDAFAQMLS